ncbi:phage related protein, partial [mine drainage metagenome]
MWVVEGEKCADALAKLGMVATTSGSADSAAAADWTPLEGRRALIWPDFDTAGQRYGETVAAKLRALGCTVAVIDAAALGLEPKGDCVDWLAQHPNATSSDVLALPILAPAEARDARGEPEPLRRPLPDAVSYPLVALGPILEPAARALLGVV